MSLLKNFAQDVSTLSLYLIEPESILENIPKDSIFSYDLYENKEINRTTPPDESQKIHLFFIKNIDEKTVLERAVEWAQKDITEFVPTFDYISYMIPVRVFKFTLHMRLNPESPLESSIKIPHIENIFSNCQIVGEESLKNNLYRIIFPAHQITKINPIIQKIYALCDLYHFMLVSKHEPLNTIPDIIQTHIASFFYPQEEK